ncbi:MAG: AMP-binding protein [Acidimicrobiales bacterium]
MLPDAVVDDPQGLALDDLTRTRTWAELGERATRAGHLFRDTYGIAPGGHASLIMGNRVEFIELVMGALMSGIWLTPINWHLTAEEAGYIVVDSESSLVITDETYESMAREAAGDLPVLVAGPELDAALAAAGAQPFSPDDVAGGSMLYTSGTTGRPKGVKRATQPTVAGQGRVARAAGHGLGLDGKGPHLVTGPLYHASPLGFSVIDLQNGAPLVIMPRWDEQTALDLIDERRVRNTHLVPTMFVRLLRLPDDVRSSFDGSSLATVLHGAAPVSVPVKTRMIDWWGPVLVEYWGGSEGGVVTLVGSDDWLEHPGTVGRATPSHEVFAADADGTRLPAGEIGPLWCRNTVTDDVFEYHNAPEKTASAYLAPGTYPLGDIGRVDEDGWVYLADRAANMIISGGVNIYPAEIEQIIVEHPAVADVGVFGIPDEEWGESVKAAVELADGFEPSDELADDILAFARRHLAGYKVPRSVDFEDELPRHPTGKLYTRLLRDRYWADTSRSI